MKPKFISLFFWKSANSMSNVKKFVSRTQKKLHCPFFIDPLRFLDNIFTLLPFRWLRGFSHLDGCSHSLTWNACSALTQLLFLKWQRPPFWFPFSQSSFPTLPAQFGSGCLTHMPFSQRH